MITTGLVVTESQKESEKGTDIKFLGFRPYFLVNPLVLETNVVVASLVPRPHTHSIHITFGIKNVCLERVKITRL